MNNSRWVQVAVTKAKQASLREERNYVFNMIRSPSPKELVPAQFRALRRLGEMNSCEKETQMELEAESVLTIRSAT